MSPFWNNVDQELKFLNMNLKTLSKLSKVPYPTITNGRNRENSIPEMETAKKIANALHKPLESLLGMDSNMITNQAPSNNLNSEFLFRKYEDIIEIFEDLPVPIMESLKNIVIKFHSTYQIMKNQYL